MVTISGMSASQAGSYFEKDMNYFEKDGGEGGTWVGKGAESLGLSEGSRVEDKDFKSLASGMDTEGNRLTRDGNKGDIDRAGLNITYSVDKSVSIMAMGDERIKDMVKDTAIESFKAVAEKYFAETRITTDGMREKEATGNLTGAAFLHETSRVAKEGGQEFPDPQLHVHIFAMNMTKDSNDNWKSLSNEKFFEFQRAMGQDFQNRIGQGLEKLGYAVERVQSGENFASGVKGISQELKDEFSTRGRGIEEEYQKREAELGRPLSGAEKQIIKNDLRETKVESTKELSEVNKSWDERLEAKGLTRDSIKEMGKGQVSDKPIESDINKSIDKATETMSDKQSVFTNIQVAGEAIKNDFNTNLADVLEKVNNNINQNISNLENKSDVLKLQDDKTNSIKITSKGVLDAEKNIQNKVSEGNKSESHQLVSKEQFTEASKDRQFFEKDFSQEKFENKEFGDIGGTDGQKAAAEHILTSKEQFVGIQGVAGSGKTTMLNEVAKISKEMGAKVEFVGLAPTGKAADEIQKATDGAIKGDTVDGFLLKNTAEKAEGTQRVYIVDESSMMGTKKMSELMDKISAQGDKAVFIGDRNQFKAVQQGDIFGKLQDDKQMNFSQMNQSVRQQSETTKSVVKDFESGNYKGAIETLKQNGNLYEGEKTEDKFGNVQTDMTKVDNQLVSNVAKDYKEVGLEKTGVVVADNATKERFNTMLRDKAQDEGLVSKEEHKTETLSSRSIDGVEKEFAGSYKLGDIVQSNKRGEVVKSGNYAEVTGINKSDNTVGLSFTSGDGKIEQKWVDATSLKNYTAYQKTEKNFADGDKIVFDKNSKELGIKNGQTAIVSKIDNDKMTVKMGEREMTFNTQTYKHFNHAYAMTGHKSQGQSIERVHVVADADKSQTMNSGYVGLTRATKEINVYTTDADKLSERYGAEHIKENASQYLENKLDNLKTTEEKVDTQTSSEVNKDEKHSDPTSPNQLLSKGIKDDFTANTEAKLEAGAKAKEYISGQWKELSNSFYTANELKALGKEVSLNIQLAKVETVDNKLLENKSLNPSQVMEKFAADKNISNSHFKAIEKSMKLQEARLNQLEEKGMVTKDDKGNYRLVATQKDFAEYRKSAEAHNDRSDLVLKADKQNSTSFSQKVDKLSKATTTITAKGVARDFKSAFYDFKKGGNSGGPVGDAIAFGAGVAYATTKTSLKLVGKIGLSLVKNIAQKIEKSRDEAHRNQVARVEKENSTQAVKETRHEKAMAEFKQKIEDVKNGKNETKEVKVDTRTFKEKVDDAKAELKGTSKEEKSPSIKNDKDDSKDATKSDKTEDKVQDTRSELEKSRDEFKAKIEEAKAEIKGNKLDKDDFKDVTKSDKTEDKADKKDEAKDADVSKENDSEKSRDKAQEQKAEKQQEKSEDKVQDKEQEQEKTEEKSQEMERSR